MEDCELFNVCSSEIWSVVISISNIICVYLAISNMNEANVFGIPKTGSKYVHVP